MSKKEYGTLTNEDEETLSPEDAVESIGTGWFQISLLIIVCFLMMSDAMETLLISVLGPELRSQWLLPEWQVALITTFVFVGMFLGGFITGWLGDIFGRRPILVMISWWITYFGILNVFSPNIVWMYILRGLVGFGLAGSFISSCLLLEYLPLKFRGKAAAIVMFSWPVGVCVESMMALFVIPTMGWRPLVLFTAIPGLLCAISFTFFLPESARYLVLAGRGKEANEWMRKLARYNKRQFKGTLTVDKSGEEPGRLRDIFVRSYCRTTVIVMLMWFLCGFIYYGNVLVTAEVGKWHRACWKQSNVTAVAPFQCTTKEGLTIEDYKTLLVASFGEFLGPIFCLCLIDVIGRRLVITSSAALAAVTLFSLQICTPPTVYQVLALASRASCSACFSSCFIYSIEVYPTSIRSLGFGIGNSMARLGAMLTPFVGQVLARISMEATIYTYVAAAAFLCLCSVLLPIETKGRLMRQTVRDADD